MSNSVLILGGYGNFGKRIASELVASGVSVIIAGRNKEKAEALAAELGDLAQPACFDVRSDALSAALAEHKPTALIDTCGPFQGADYRVAEACIRHKVHYIDLADGRGFVAGITALDAAAKEVGISVISGASTVPALASAVLEKYKHEFASIDALNFGISPGQKAERGLATTQAILSYVGKPLKPYAGHPKPYGWQNIRRQAYPDLGKRWMANCDIPDLDLLPERYGIKSIQFGAGLELSILHLGLWACSWLVRLGLPIKLEAFAKPLWSAAKWFDGFGSADGGMHVIMQGTAPDGSPHKREWYIVAKDGYGPYIPTIPSIVLARKLVKGEALAPGAHPCVGDVTLDEYAEATAGQPVEMHVM